MKKPITEEWERFESFVVPREASDIQRKEMRSAFFAGALSLFNSIMNQLEDTGNPDDLIVTGKQKTRNAPTLP